MHLATAIPRGPGGDWSRNDRIRREGTANLLAAAAAQGVRRYIQQSIVMLYGDTGSTMVDESAPLQPRPGIQSAADMEEFVRQSGMEWCILRGALFYEAGAGLEDEWRQAARRGELILPGDGSDRISLIHTVDMARAVVTAVESAPAGSIYNVVDDEPPTYADVVRVCCCPGGRGAAGSGRCTSAAVVCVQQCENQARVGVAAGVSDVSVGAGGVRRALAAMCRGRRRSEGKGGDVLRASLAVKIGFFTTEAGSLASDVILEVNRLGEIFGSRVKLALS